MIKSKSKNLFLLFLTFVTLVFSFIALLLPSRIVSCYAADTTELSSSFVSSNIMAYGMGSSSSTSNVKFTNLSNYSLDYWAFTYQFKIDIIPFSSEPGSFDVNFSIKAINNGSYMSNINHSDGNTVFQSVGSYLYRSNDVTWSNPAVFNVRGWNSRYTAFDFGVSIPSPLVYPTGIMSMIEFGNYSDNNKPIPCDGNNAISTGGYFNWVRFTDTSGWKYSYFIPVQYNGVTNSIGSKPNYYFNYRYYYLNVNTDLSDNVYYEQGYTAGYSAGLGQGSSSGYGDGYRDGNLAGYNTGYDAGVNASNNYSFNSLFGAVIDAPLNAFKSLFNFELLGVNLLGLFTGLVTLAFVILIVKLVLGGK